MTNALALEPFLYYLHEHANGSWSQFRRAASAFDPNLDAFSLARGLSEHALVEFLWDGDKRWSVTSATAIICNKPGGRVSLWGGTHRAADALAASGIPCQIETRRIVGTDTTYTYRQAIAIRTNSWSELKEHVPVINSRDVLGALPSLNDLLDRAPEASLPSSNASTFRYVYRFGSTSPMDPAPFAAENNSLWRIGSRIWLFVRDGNIRRVPGWLGKWLLYASERRETYAAHYVNEGGMLVLPFAPLLPAPYVRALLLGEAMEIPAAQFGTRAFSNVDPSLARSICEKLSADMEVTERRTREIA